MQTSLYKRVLTAAMLVSSSICLPVTFDSVNERSENHRRQQNLNSAAQGQVDAPPSGNTSASASPVNFQDEVIDISSISIFGDVNDGGSNCTAEVEPGNDAPLESAAASDTSTTSSQGVTFGDEVVDISGISVFGDVNDVGCD